MKMRKSLLALVLAAVVAISCMPAFAAEELTYPLVSEPLTLTAYATGTRMTEPETNTMNVEYEKMTGVHIEWELGSDRATDLNLYAASGEYPDFFMCELSADQVTMLLEAGALSPLTEAIDAYAPNMSKILEEDESIRKMLITPDGNIYTYFYTDSGLHMPNRRKFFVYQAWLDEYIAQTGKAMPETTEELEDMLVFFRDSDLNGNGEQDEIPFIGSTNSQDNPVYYLMNAFTTASDNFFHISDEGEIVFEANTDAWREGLKFLAHLNEEGLFYAEETFVQDRDQLKSLVNIAEPSNFIVASFPGFWQGTIVNNSVLRWLDYTAIPPVAGPDGVRGAMSNGMSKRLQCAVSSTCPDVNTAVKWLDYWLSEEGNFHWHWGMIEGEDYEMVDIPAISGASQSVVALKDSYTDNNILGATSIPVYDRPEVRYAASYDESTFNTANTWALYSAGLSYEPYYVNTNIPNVVWCTDSEIINSVAEYKSMIEDVVKTAYTEFILGIRDINDDAQWDAYLDDLNTYGLETYLELLAQYYA